MLSQPHVLQPGQVLLSLGARTPFCLLLTDSSVAPFIISLSASLSSPVAAERHLGQHSVWPVVFVCRIESGCLLGEEVA